MNVDVKDFIAIYPNVYQNGYCRHLISEFEKLVSMGAGTTRKVEGSPRHHKDDISILFNLKQHCVGLFNDMGVEDIFFDGLQSCYDHYSEYFSVLKDCDVRATYMKVQKTPPMGGYHLIHTEKHKGINANRTIVYVLYLNSLNAAEGGETEFLYQKRRIKPVENTLVLFPAGYTHPHRGNPVLGDNSKYIITGWFYHEEF